MVKRDLLKDIGKSCPRCGDKLHIGQKKFKEEKDEVEYCKNCGYRVEVEL